MSSESQSNPLEGGDRTGTRTTDPSPEVIEQVIAFTPLMARLDVAVAAIVALTAATITIAMPKLIASGGIDIERDFATMSAALIPQIAFGILAALATIVLVSAVQTVRSGIGRPRAAELSGLRRAAIALAIAVFYALSVTWLGYILATMLMTAAMAGYLGLRNPLTFIPGVLIVPIAIRFVFERLLLISLPRSSIESVGVVEDAVMRFLAHTLLS
ncbi:MAG: tripartite tricarboxylate transporter TctB family protein [Pseudolabrys sp.]|nr:tripartite tricarboxylate transporter TctB family protein [Pseudolabrys sp.]